MTELDIVCSFIYDCYLSQLEDFKGDANLLFECTVLGYVNYEAIEWLIVNYIGRVYKVSINADYDAEDVQDREFEKVIKEILDSHPEQIFIKPFGEEKHD